MLHMHTRTYTLHTYMQGDALVRELDKLMALVLRDFVDEWYRTCVSGEDKEFSRHVLIEHALQ